MTNQYPPVIQRFVDAVLTTPGDTRDELRCAVQARAAQNVGRPDNHESDEVPEELTRYVDKVAKHAYKATPAEVEPQPHPRSPPTSIFKSTTRLTLVTT